MHVYRYTVIQPYKCTRPVRQLRIQIAHLCYQSQVLYTLLLWSCTNACQKLRLLQAALSSITDLPHVVAMPHIQPTQRSTLRFLQQTSEQRCIQSLPVETALCCRTPAGLPSMPKGWMHIPKSPPLSVHRNVMWTTSGV